jgi:3-oxoadipate enol-lactonase
VKSRQRALGVIAVNFRQVLIGDCILNVLDVETSESLPVLVLVHGFPLDHTMWTSQILGLSQRARIIAIDLCGFGRSSTASGTLSMERMARDVATVLDDFRITQPITLCGLSMGGYIAFAFWKQFARRLERLVLCDTRAAADAPAAAEKRLASAARLEKENDISFLVADMLPKLFGESTRSERPRVIEATKAVMSATSPHSAAAALRGMAERASFESSLGKIAVPTLVVCGEHDAITPAAEMRTFAKAIPHSKYVEIPDAGHMSPLEQPALFNAALESFLTA